MKWDSAPPLSYWLLTRYNPPTCAAGSKTRKSTATATCACNIWRVLGLNVDLGGPIYDDIIGHAHLPAAIFVGADDRVGALDDALRKTHGFR